MSNKWIKKDDTVVVLTGNESGRTGKILSRKGDRVVVQGLNIRKKHAKRKTKVPTPGVMEIEMPIHISNVCICAEDGKPIKLKVRQSADGQTKELVYHEGKKDVVFRKLRVPERRGKGK
ncbi:MAG: 50S ribosomal protein L24 [Chlamydiales bacterium]